GDRRADRGDRLLVLGRGPARPQGRPSLPARRGRRLPHGRGRPRPRGRGRRVGAARGSRLGALLSQRAPARGRGAHASRARQVRPRRGDLMAARRTGRPAWGGRARVRGRAALGATFVALLAVGPLSPGTSSSSAAATGGPTAAGPRVVTEETAAVPAVVVTEVTPRSVGPDDTVSVSALLTNTTDALLEKLHAHLGVVRYRLSSREALRGWAAGEVTTAAPTPVADLDLDEPLEPGASRTVTFTAPAADLRLLPYPETSGARGIVVTFSDDARGQLG